MAHSLPQMVAHTSSSMHPTMEQQPGTTTTVDAFVAEECLRQGLVPMNLVGTSETELECAHAAEEARERYKAKIHEEAVRRPRRMLSDAQKYEQRLVNNRRSAAASKVSHHIKMAQQATRLRSLVKENQELKEALRLNACLFLDGARDGQQRKRHRISVEEFEPPNAFMADCEVPSKGILGSGDGEELGLFPIAPFL